jgi:hypothetical protein
LHLSITSSCVNPSFDYPDLPLGYFEIRIVTPVIAWGMFRYLYFYQRGYNPTSAQVLGPLDLTEACRRQYGNPLATAREIQGVWQCVIQRR